MRLLLVPMRRLSADDRASVMRRFLVKEAEHLAQGGTLDDEHHQKLAEAWSTGCQALSASQRAELRALAPAAVQLRPRRLPVMRRCAR